MRSPDSFEEVEIQGQHEKFKKILIKLGGKFPLYKPVYREDVLDECIKAGMSKEDALYLIDEAEIWEPFE